MIMDSTKNFADFKELLSDEVSNSKRSVTIIPCDDTK